MELPAAPPFVRRRQKRRNQKIRFAKPERTRLPSARIKSVDNMEPSRCSRVALSLEKTVNEECNERETLSHSHPPETFGTTADRGQNGVRSRGTAQAVAGPSWPGISRSPQALPGCAGWIDEYGPGEPLLCRSRPGIGPVAGLIRATGMIRNRKGDPGYQGLGV
jgi:hypothetical protein